MKKEIMICDICDKEIDNSYKFSKVKRWNQPVELDVCFNCITYVIRLLKKLQIDYNEYETDLSRIINEMNIED